MSESILLAVNGTLMRGLELNVNMQRAQAQFVADARTANCYRLWSINDRHPAMMRTPGAGREIELELWSVPAAGLADILTAEPAGLCVGKVLLSDGREVLGVLGEPFLCAGRTEITHLGGWRGYLLARGLDPASGEGR
jgi:hypothetical protein